MGGEEAKLFLKRRDTRGPRGSLRSLTQLYGAAHAACDDTQSAHDFHLFSPSLTKAERRRTKNAAVNAERADGPCMPLHFAVIHQHSNIKEKKNSSTCCPVGDH